MPWVVMGYYLMYFYTDVVGFTGTFAGFLMVAARLFDAFTDILLGWALDHFNFRWGKYRSWLRFAIAPLFIMFVLTFTAVPGQETLNIILAALGYGCYGAIAQTLCYIPLNAQLANMTRNPEERASLTAYKGAVNNIATLVVVISYMPLVRLLSGVFGSTHLGFFTATVIFAIVSIIPILLNYRISEKYELNYDGTYREHLHENAQSKDPIGRQLKDLFTNRPAVVTMLGVLILMLLQGVRSGTVVYMFEYYFEMPEFTSISLFFNAGLAIVGAFLVRPFIKLFKDTNRAYVVTILLSSALYLCFFFVVRMMGAEAARTSMHFGPLFFFFAFCGLFQGAHYSFMYAVIPGAVDYGVWKYNRNMSGFIYAFFGMITAIGGAFGGQLLGVLLDGIGYVSGQQMTGDTLHSMLRIAVLIPALLGLAQAVVQLFYGVSDKQLAQYAEEVKLRQEET